MTSKIHGASSNLWQRSAAPPAAPASPAIAPSPAGNPPYSKLVAAIEARPRPLKAYDAETFFPGVAGAKVFVRVPTSAEIGRALKCAHAFIAEETKNAPTAAEDPVYTSDIKTAFALFESMRDERDPNGLPAFPDPQWMREKFTTQQLSVLLNMHNETVGETEPVEWVLDGDRLSALMFVCAQHAGTEIADQALLRFSRETMAEAFIRASVMYKDAMVEIEALRAQLAEVTGVSPEPPAEEPPQEEQE